MTDNPKLLSQYFQIIPDNFVTIRLLDLTRSQPPILSLPGHNTKSNRFYSRKVLTGPFTVDNLCKFVKGKDGGWKEYYERNDRLGAI